MIVQTYGLPERVEYIFVEWVVRWNLFVCQGMCIHRKHRYQRGQPDRNRHSPLDQESRRNSSGTSYRCLTRKVRMLSGQDQIRRECEAQHGDLSDAWAQSKHQRLIAFAFVKTLKTTEMPKFRLHYLIAAMERRKYPQRGSGPSH